jgi:hypothetical protein
VRNITPEIVSAVILLTKPCIVQSHKRSPLHYVITDLKIKVAPECTLSALPENVFYCVAKIPMREVRQKRTSVPFQRADKMAEHVICCSCRTYAIAVHRRKIWCMLTTLWKHTLSLPGLGICILNTFFSVLLKETVYETIMTVWDGSASICCFICLFANVVTNSVVSNDKVTYIW